MPEVTPEDLRQFQTTVSDINAQAAAVVKKSVFSVEPFHASTALVNAHRELVGVYQATVRGLDTAERLRDRLDNDHAGPTPLRIKRQHAERVKEQYHGPVLNLALMLLESNRREWLHQKHETNGAEVVERHGLTTNQRRWLNELNESWRVTHGEC